MPHIIAMSPSECSPEKLAAFAEMVRQGGEVTNEGLEGRISSAHRLAFCFDRKELIGIAAIKNPLASYRAKVSHNSGVSLGLEVWPFELGWVFVSPWARKGGVGKAVVEAALVGISEGVFGTARTDNVGMQAMFRNFQFTKAGNAYASDRQEHELQLFLRAAPHQ